MKKTYEKGQVLWQEDMEKVHVYMPKMHTRYHASLWEQTYQKSYCRDITSFISSVGDMVHNMIILCEWL